MPAPSFARLDAFSRPFAGRQDVILSKARQLLGDAALALPIGAPFERSFSGTLEASPKPIDGVHALIERQSGSPARDTMSE